MESLIKRSTGCLLLFAWVVLPALARNEACLSCHAKEVVSGHVIPAVYDASAHGGLKCVQCHSDFSESRLPHGPTAKKVDCAKCHSAGLDGAAKTPALVHAYLDSVHGRIWKQGGSKKTGPTCASCHGVHDILPSSNPKSKTYRLNLSATCGQCHSEQRYFDKSIHGLALFKKNEKSATCIDCHGSHDIQPASMEVSHVSRMHVPDTCGKCHAAIESQYLAGIHGQALKQGRKEAPICSTCHGEHDIQPPGNPNSSVSPQRIAETCSHCHESLALQTKFNMPSGRLTSFEDSFHGVALQYGVLTVANCASCHGAHEILPSRDPRSPVNPKNLPKTCGKCHSNVSQLISMGKVHVIPENPSAGSVYIINRSFKILTLSVVTLLFIHMFFDILSWKKVQRANEARTREAEARGEAIDPKVKFRRFVWNQRFQHLVMAVGVILLMLTGLSLKYHDSAWSHQFFPLIGGFMVSRVIHRIGAALLIWVAIWHTVWLVSPQGRRELRYLAPQLKDVTDLWKNIKFLTGFSPERPRFGRFSYIEKFDYWAVYWGCFVMIGTGVILWFHDFSMAHFPKYALDIAHEAHSDEGLLATLCIVVWHWYNVHFKPPFFPFNPTIFTGEISGEMMRDEHPLEYEEMMRNQGGAVSPQEDGDGDGSQESPSDEDEDHRSNAG
jgi:cytochrome b subunit of formate dehydrogenase